MKKLLLLSIFLTILFFQLRPGELTHEKVTTLVLKAPSAAVVTVPLLLIPVLPKALDLQRAPAQARPAEVTRPTRRQDQVVMNEEIPLQNGDWVAKNIVAIPTANYSAQMGLEVYHDKHFTYFAGKSDDAIPVAFDPRTQRFHPISSILMLKKIDEEIRQEILKEGHKEYYYHARMKLLSVESTPAEVLSLYQDFKNRGWNVQLEVIKESPKTH